MKEKSCGAIVLNKNNKILIIQNIDGFYGFPKGHVEKNETEEETAIREVKEETNIDIEIISNKKFIISYKTDKNIDKDVILFLAKPLTNNLKPQENEVKEVLWININEVINYLSFNDTKEIWNNEIKPEIINIFGK